MNSPAVLCECTHSVVNSSLDLREIPHVGAGE